MNWERWFWIMTVLCFFVLGCWFGFVLHESLMFKGAVAIAEGLEGTTFNIDVDMNETQIVDRIADRMGIFPEGNSWDCNNKSNNCVFVNEQSNEGVNK